jgi:Rrf2 family protein
MSIEIIELFYILHPRVKMDEILTFLLELIYLAQMRLSLKGEYALRALLVLGLNYGEGVVRIETVSRQQNIPKKFLEQILNDLKALGAVESRRGAAGGYRLARPPQNITLA